MKETVFALIVLGFLGGCAETGEQKSPPKAEKEVFFKGLPVELHLPSDEGIPVKVHLRDEEGRPIKVEVKGDKALPVDVNIKGDKVLPVKLDTEGGEGLLVEVKLPQVALIYIAIFAATILIIAIVTCFTAVGAARSAKAACQSADAIKKAQEQSKSDLHDTNKD